MPVNSPEKLLLTISELAEMIGLAVGTIYHMVSEERIPVVRLSGRCIRFRKSDIEDWIDSLTEQVRDCHSCNPRRLTSSKNRPFNKPQRT